MILEPCSLYYKGLNFFLSAKKLFTVKTALAWLGLVKNFFSELTLVIVEDSKCVSVLVSKELSHHNIRVLLNQTKISENVNKLNFESGSIKLLCSTLNQLNVKYHQISDKLKWIVEWRPWNWRGWQTTRHYTNSLMWYMA